METRDLLSIEEVPCRFCYPPTRLPAYPPDRLPACYGVAPSTIRARLAGSHCGRVGVLAMVSPRW